MVLLQGLFSVCSSCAQSRGNHHRLPCCFPFLRYGFMRCQRSSEPAVFGHCSTIRFERELKKLNRQNHCQNSYRINLPQQTRYLTPPSERLFCQRQVALSTAWLSPGKQISCQTVSVLVSNTASKFTTLAVPHKAFF